MLEAMRKGAGTWVAKIFMGLLVLSFGVWGIADIFGGYGAQTVATVGETEISAQTYQIEFRREVRQLGRRLGRDLTGDEAKSIGLDRQVLLRLIGDAALQSQANSLGLGISAKAVAASIRRDPVFQDASGKFSKEKFYRVLVANGLSEQDFLEGKQRALVLQQIADPLSTGSNIPDVLLHAANRFRNEERKFNYFIVPFEKAGAIGEPATEKLREFYNSRKSEFTFPEYRAVSMLVVSPDALLNQVEVKEEELKDYFERNKDRFGSPERRAVLQVPFPDEATAQDAYKKLVEGADLMDIAKARDLTKKDVDLGLVAKSQILDETVADAIFALPVDELSKPIKGQLATVIAKVTKIEPAVVTSFESERENIRKILAAQRTAGKALDLYDKIEDDRAAGLTLAEIAKKEKLKYEEIEAVDGQGRDSRGKTIEALANEPKVLQAIFQAESGVETDPEETSNKGFVWYDVRKVTPSRQMTFDEAKNDVEKKWREEQERSVLSKKGQELVDSLRSGTPMSSISEELGAEMKESGPLKRTAQTADLTKAAIQQGFALSKGGYGSASTKDGKGRIVFQVADVILPEHPDSKTRDAIENSLAAGIADDLIVQYIRALRGEYGVQINQKVLEDATSGRQYSGRRPAGAI